MAHNIATLPRSVAVIGAGSWGTALAALLAGNIARVKLYGRNAELMAEMARQRRNPRYLPAHAFPPNVQVESRLDDLLDDDLAFVLAVPSHAFGDSVAALRAAIQASGRSVDDAAIIWGTKGFDPGSGRLLSEVVAQAFTGSAALAAISGPSFAAETASNLPTALTVACLDLQVAQTLANWFRAPATRVYFSDDLIGVQLGGAIKNVMAIAAGISDGLGFGANARAALITRGLAELTRLGVALGGRADTFAGLTGVGDLILTCTDDQSRNRRFGLGIGLKRPAALLREEIGQEIEGINSARELRAISRRLGVEMPITEQVFRVLHEGHDPQRAVQNLLARDPRSE